MKKKIFNYLEMAAQIALSKDDKRNFLIGSVGIRGDGAIVSAFNSPTPSPDRRIHSEYRLASKLDYGATVYVARVGSGNSTHKTTKFSMAKPCPDCMRVLFSKRVKKIYYTISDKEYGIIFP